VRAFSLLFALSPLALCSLPFALRPLPFALCPLPFALCPLLLSLCPPPSPCFILSLQKILIMKILPVEMIREADAYTIKHEPIASIDLMERAAYQSYRWIRKRTDHFQPVMVFCGPGNNGGDGLVIARMLAKENYDVRVFILSFTTKYSDDFSINLKRLEMIDKVDVVYLSENDNLPDITAGDIVIDAIFGSGLSKPVTGFPARVIKHINQSDAAAIAVDAPSGLFSDEPTDNKTGAIVQADYTLTFQFPKFSFLFPENEIYVGQWHVLPIGLMDEFTNQLDVKNFMVHREDAVDLLKTRHRFAHKGHFGHALLIAGGYGKMGAAVLAAKGTIKAGAGLVTAHIPKSGNQIIQTSIPEAMVSIDEDEFVFSKPPDLSPYNAIALGPGLGTARQTQQAIKLLIQNTGIPLLFDADAINILSENKTYVSFIPQNSIFTPHPKEFERLFGKMSNDFERNKKQREFSLMHKVYIVLKGAYTCISTPDGKCFFNTTGNPGMATGGSGDVLTGIILGLLAQNYHPQEACILGVYLHGLAGDIAAKKFSQQAMTAGDIIKALPKAFKKIILL
jgi:ADP-dependent NAD(P)H-hydrate dehydratase / NAD(P)H-hydrate epimerase